MTNAESESRCASAIADLAAAGFRCVNEEALRNGEWWTVILECANTRIGIAHHLTNYYQCFDVVKAYMTDHEYASSLREIWIAADGLDPVEANRLLRNHGREVSKEMWMNAGDARELSELPESVTVYRGSLKGRELGCCWSLKREVAEEFAHRDSNGGSEDRVVVTGIVQKGDIFALFSNLEIDEREVVILDTERITIVRSDSLA